jgi:predicted nucleic acid-binding Zn ribbon protein
MPFQSLKEILPQTLHALGIGDRVRERQVIRAWQAAVAAVAPRLAAAGEPAQLDGGVLTIRVAEPAAATGLASREADLLQAMTSHLSQTGVPAIERLHFQLKRNP